MLWRGETVRAIEKLTRQADEYCRGNMAEKIRIEDYPDQLKGLAGHIADLAGMLRNFAQETQVSSGKVSGAVKQVNAAITDSHDLAENIHHDAELTMQLAADLTEAAGRAVKQIEDVKAATETITATAETIYHKSIDNKKTAEMGCAAVNEVAQAMNDIQSASGEIEQRIFALTQAAKEIDNFLNTIRGISSQTNLLALNATIEAARAGEHGRGFAVVAHEIQKLSDASSDAANSANRLLVQIDTGVVKAAEAVKLGAESVQSGIRAMKEADGSLKAIASASTEVETQLAQASAARQTQLAATVQATNSLEKMLTLCHSVEERIVSVTADIEQQEKHHRETGRMGELLAEVARELVDTTAMIHLVSLQEEDRVKLDAQIQTLRKELEGIAADEQMAELDASRHEAVLTRLLERHSELEAAWTNFSDGRFIVSLPPAGIANASSREWFQAAVKGTFYVSSVYVSAISHQPCITISLPVKGTADTVLAVLGVDLRLDQ